MTFMAARAWAIGRAGRARTPGAISARGGRAVQTTSVQAEEEEERQVPAGADRAASAGAS
ncbi:MAG: hypothetical protein M0C28_45455 [Candidatus Moduliflexus flocculans]|nr:hypothetical protein [Candidatus Moduliflexus flocculans]